MSLNLAPSLPSFAQAFGAQSLTNLNSNNALPPIRSDSMHSSPLLPQSSRPPSAQPVAARKRSRSPHSNHPSPPQITIKEEHEQDSAASPTSPTTDASSPSPLKKRRVTVSGTAPTLRPPPDQAGDNPISPVAMAFPINKRDTVPSSDHIRSTSSAKQKQQKPFADQHRPNGMPIPSTDDRLSATSSIPSPLPSARSMRRSPNTVSSIRRPSASLVNPGTRPPSPNPVQQPLSIAARTSFARRRAAQFGTGRKPADLQISPRDADTPDQRPLVQSAPPIPDRGQSALYTDRLPIALPRLPSILNSTGNVRRVASNVPPTPTRLSMQPRPPPPPPPTIQTPQPAVSGRSPPAASIPIATTLVPPTPSALHHPGYSGDKAGFLAPFETFYNALNDSKELKKWLGEQLTKSNSLMQSLAQQQEKMNDLVETLVEAKVAGMRSEMAGLQRRVEELEEALRQVTNRPMSDRERQHKNGLVDSHAYLAAETSRSKADSARTGPSWAQERDTRGDQETGDIRSNHHLHPHAQSSRGHHADRSVARSPKLTTGDRGNASPNAS